MGMDKWAWEKNPPLASRFWHSPPKQDWGGVHGSECRLPEGRLLWISLGLRCELRTLLQRCHNTEQYRQRDQCYIYWVSLIVAKSDSASKPSAGVKWSNPSTTLSFFTKHTTTDTCSILLRSLLSILYYTAYLVPNHICHNVQYFILYIMMCVLHISWIIWSFLCNCFVRFVYNLEKFKEVSLVDNHVILCVLADKVPGMQWTAMTPQPLSYTLSSL